MDSQETLEEEGFCFSLKECKCIFRILKAMESKLNDEELYLLNKIEKLLYSRLTIKEINDLVF